MTLVVGSKIFLGKYRVAADEVGGVEEPSDRPATFEGEEIGSGKKIRIEIVPIRSLKTGMRPQLEASAIAAKNLNHLNIQPLNDFGLQDDCLVYVRENLEGTLLSEWVKNHGPMPVGPVLRIAAQVVSALGAAGFHRIVHSAINPNNLMLVPGEAAEGQWPLLKVLHFEKDPHEFLTTETTARHNNFVAYTSPEQLGYGVVDFGSEVYSLGATMCFLLTGTPPTMTAEGVMVGLSADKRSASDPIKTIPEKLRVLLTKMLSINRGARPKDPLPFYNQLQDCLTEMGPRESMLRPLTPQPISGTRAILPSSERHLLTKTVAMVGLCLTITVAAVFFLKGYIHRGRSVQAAQRLEKRVATPSPVVSPKSGSSAGPVVTLATGKSETRQQSPASALNLSLVGYTPMVGMPGEKDFKIATVTFRIEASSLVRVTDASFYVDSAPFIDGSTQKLPITLLVHTGVFLGPPGTKVDPSHSIERTVWLKSQENLFPNWQLAYNQTENATFRWTLGGQRVGGSVVIPLHKVWSTPRATPEVRRAAPVKKPE
jgi:serine/threonine protein kinase